MIQIQIQIHEVCTKLLIQRSLENFLIVNCIFEITYYISSMKKKLIPFFSITSTQFLGYFLNNLVIDDVPLVIL